jgi:hypothetical protein
MNITDKDIKKYARKMHYELKNYKGKDTMKLFSQSLHKMRKYPIKYLEEEFKRILTEPRLPRI